MQRVDLQTVQKKILKTVFAGCALLSFFAAVQPGAAQTSTCVAIQSPPPGKLISSPLCTISVTVCPDVRVLTLQAQLRPAHAAAESTITIAVLTSAPFVYHWDLSRIPNQLYSGFTLIARAQSWGSRAVYVDQVEGIFLNHQPINRPVFDCSYISSSTFPDQYPSWPLQASGATSRGHAQVGWNENELFVRVDVQDVLFYTTMPKAKYAALGVDILIDPLLHRDVMPSPQSVTYAIPLLGKPHRLFSKPEFNKNRSFVINEFTQEASNTFTVHQEDFKGYTVDFTIPWKEIFVDGKPAEFGFNIVAKTLNRQGEIQKISLIEVSYPDALYAPASWGVLRCQPKPFWANTMLLWVLSFWIGLVIGLLAVLAFFVVRIFTRSTRRRKHTRQEEETYESIRAVIESQVSNRSLTVEMVAEQIGMPASRVESLIRSFCGESLKVNLMRARIEIAKERLRSSHSTESSVAQSSGFASKEEMERYFKKFYRISPLQFREENQVS